MTHPSSFFAAQQPVASGSSFKPKRKHNEDDDDAQHGAKLMRVRSPVLRHRVSFQPPALDSDHSASASDDDQMMEMDADETMQTPMDEYGAGASGVGRGSEYHFGSSGSGGFGFGPGAAEDEDEHEMLDEQKPAHYPNMDVYPSLVPHPNPNHFSNIPPYTSMPTSPFSAQAFSTSLSAPAPRGLMQPSQSAALRADASDVEKARAQHGPWCKSIPRLVMSNYADPMTGQKSMYTMCQDCGMVEKAA